MSVRHAVADAIEAKWAEDVDVVSNREVAELCDVMHPDDIVTPEMVGRCGRQYLDDVRRRLWPSGLDTSYSGGRWVTWRPATKPLVAVEHAPPYAWYEYALVSIGVGVVALSAMLPWVRGIICWGFHE